MGIMDNDEAERRLIEALKFVKVSVRNPDYPTSGFLTDTTCGDVPPPPGDPTAGSINCTLDGRNCEPGQRR